MTGVQTCALPISATVRLNDESEAEGILQSLVDELISTNLQEQPTVGDFVSFFMCCPYVHCTPYFLYLLSPSKSHNSSKDDIPGIISECSNDGKAG